MSFCNVMMSCYVEVVKQVTVLVLTTCESVNSHLLLSPCTSLELATCTLQKSFPKIYHQFLSVSLAVQPLKCSTFSGIHPIPIWRFSFNWQLKEEENWVPHEPTKQKWSQLSGSSTILTTYIFVILVQKIHVLVLFPEICYIDSTQNWHLIGCSLSSVETPRTGGWLQLP